MGHDHPGSGPLELKTSPGLPYVLDRYANKPKGKRAYINFDYDEEIPIYTMSPDVESELMELDRNIRSGFVPANSMYEFPKDELRPRECGILLTIVARLRKGGQRWENPTPTTTDSILGSFFSRFWS